MKMSSKAILGIAVCSALGLASTAEASLIIDLRAVSASSGNTTISNAGKTVSITSASLNDTITFDVYAVITGPGTFGLQAAAGAFIVPGNTSTTKGTFAANGAITTTSPNPVGWSLDPWNNSGAQPGLQQDIYTNGNLDLGSDATINNTSSAFAVARALSVVTTGFTAISGGAEQKVGSVTFKITTVGTNGTDTPLTFLPKTNTAGAPLSTSATWKEDTNSTRSPTNSTYAGGTPVQIHVGGVVVSTESVSMTTGPGAGVQVSEGDGTAFDGSFPKGATTGAPPTPIIVPSGGAQIGSLHIQDLTQTGDIYVLIRFANGKGYSDIHTLTGTALPANATVVDLTNLPSTALDWISLNGAYGNFAKVGIKFAGQAAATNNYFNWDFSTDGLSVDEIVAVPEPASLGLAAVGATSLLLRRRRAVK